MVTEDGKAACCETTMSVMIFALKRNVAGGQLRDTPGDTEQSQTA